MEEKKEVDSKESLADKKGLMAISLRRDKSSIIEDRALTILKEAEIRYKREIENIEIQIDKLKTERKELIDFSSDDATSIAKAKNFIASSFVEKDIDLGVKIKNYGIALEIAKERVGLLFGA